MIYKKQDKTTMESRNMSFEIFVLWKGSITRIAIYHVASNKRGIWLLLLDTFKNTVMLNNTTDFCKTTYGLSNMIGVQEMLMNTLCGSEFLNGCLMEWYKSYLISLEFTHALALSKTNIMFVEKEK